MEKNQEDGGLGPSLHLDISLHPLSGDILPVTIDRGDSKLQQVDGRLDEPDHVGRPPTQKAHEPHVEEVAEQLDGGGAETESKVACWDLPSYSKMNMTLKANVKRPR